MEPVLHPFLSSPPVAPFERQVSQKSAFTGSLTSAPDGKLEIAAAVGKSGRIAERELLQKANEVEKRVRSWKACRRRLDVDALSVERTWLSDSLNLTASLQMLIYASQFITE